MLKKVLLDVKDGEQGTIDREEKSVNKVMVSSGMFNPDGSPNRLTLAALSRTYMPITAGTLQQVSYDSVTKHYTAVYEATP